MIHDSCSSFSIKDLEASRKFYSRILGLRVETPEMGILELHPPGSNRVWMYPKPDHEPATFTVLNLMVEDLNKEADRLLELGISFEQYPGIPMDERGIHRSGNGPTIAWFKDPSGNILSLIEKAPTA